MVYNGGSNEAFIIDRIKAPFTSAIHNGKRPDLLKLMSEIRRLPKPTRARVHMPNSPILIDLRDKFLSALWRRILFGWAAPLIDGVIILYDYDGYYGDRIDFVLCRWKRWGWKVDLPTIERLRAEFFACEDNPGRKPDFEYIWNIVTTLFQRSRLFRYVLCWSIHNLQNQPWAPRRPQRPSPRFWREWGAFGRYGQGKATPILN